MNQQPPQPGSAAVLLGIVAEAEPTIQAALQHAGLAESTPASDRSTDQQHLITLAHEVSRRRYELLQAESKLLKEQRRVTELEVDLKVAQNRLKAPR